MAPSTETVEFIVPCFNERENVGAFYAAFSDAFEGCPLAWRLIMVDDGSTDGTAGELHRIASLDERVTVVRFSRNFGKEAAIYAGLEFSRGDYVGIIDADLQQPPQVAREMLGILLDDDECDCVAAYQEQRREHAAVSLLKRRFYRVFAKAARSDLIADASDFRVFRRSVADAVLELKEYFRFSKGIFAWIGFETRAYPYIPEERAAGDSKWSLGSLFGYALEGLLSFSTSPLHFITKLGVVVSVIAVLYAVILIIRTLVLGVDVPGYASTISLVLLFGGGQFFAIGVIGEYLARTYIQGKGRPVYIVKSTENVPRGMMNDSAPGILRPNEQEPPQLGTSEIPRSTQDDGHSRGIHRVPDQRDE